MSLNLQQKAEAYADKHGASYALETELIKCYLAGANAAGPYNGFLAGYDSRNGEVEALRKLLKEAERHCDAGLRARIALLSEPKQEVSRDQE